MGIIERIATAASITELEALQKELDGYNYASTKTTRKAARTATDRRAYLFNVAQATGKCGVPVRNDSEETGK
jgi:hypothetical protein